jgi:hypothetical protein
MPDSKYFKGIPIILLKILGPYKKFRAPWL